MALKTKDFPVLGEDIKSLEITNGPNDWDLWLCLRRTIRTVTFYTGNMAFLVPTAGDPKTWLEVKITSISEHEPTFNFKEEWELKGETRNCGYVIPFKAIYDSKTREGTANVESKTVLKK